MLIVYLMPLNSTMLAQYKTTTHRIRYATYLFVKMELVKHAFDSGLDYEICMIFHIINVRSF